MAGKRIFAACAPGLETLTAQEIGVLGYSPIRVDAVPSSNRKGSAGQPESSEFTGGGVEVLLGAGEKGSSADRSSLEAIYRLNLSLRTASRVLVRLGEFYAAAFAELRKKAGRLEWEKYLQPGQAVALRVSCHKSRLYHSDAVAERVLGAIGDRLGRPVRQAENAEKDHTQLAQLIVVRLHRDQVTISIDSSGEHLHRRGYRLETAKAPLRETLAAAMLLASGWDRRSPLLDPFCGSGTIPIEAALLANDMNPGGQRRFAFMVWPGYDANLFGRLQNGSRLAEKSNKPGETSAEIFGSDRDAGAIEISRANAVRARVIDRIDFSSRAMSAVEPPVGPGWVVTNPPYGLRVSGQKDLRNLYAQLGNVLRQKCQGWHYAILCNDQRLFLNSGLRADYRLAFDNGGLPVRMYCGTIAST